MSKKTETKSAAPTVRQYEIIQKPAITEKSTQGSEFGHVTFRVPVSATKTEIKAAVEAIYKVKVKAVNTSTLMGKIKLFKGVKGQRQDVKKAIVTLEKGQQIDLTAAV